MKTEPNNSAFPNPHNNFSKGVTIREWFTGMALMARGAEWGEQGLGYDRIAQSAIAQADALIAELSKESEKV